MNAVLSQDATTLFALLTAEWIDEMRFAKRLGWNDERVMNARVELTDAGYAEAKWIFRKETVVVRRKHH